MSYQDHRVYVTVFQDLLQAISGAGIPSCLLKDNVFVVKRKVGRYLYRGSSDDERAETLEKLCEWGIFCQFRLSRSKEETRKNDGRPWVLVVDRFIPAHTIRDEFFPFGRTFDSFYQALER